TYAAHALDAPGDDDVVRALRDLGGSEVDGVESASAKARNLHAGGLVVIAGLEGSRARNDRACLADRIDAAEDDVVHRRRVEPVAVADGFQRFCRQSYRRNLV